MQMNSATSSFSLVMEWEIAGGGEEEGRQWAASPTLPRPPLWVTQHQRTGSRNWGGEQTEMRRPQNGSLILRTEHKFHKDSPDLVFFLELSLRLWLNIPKHLCVLWYLKTKAFGVSNARFCALKSDIWEVFFSKLNTTKTKTQQWTQQRNKEIAKHWRNLFLLTQKEKYGVEEKLT